MKSDKAVPNVRAATASGSLRINGWKLALDRAPLFLSVLLLFILPFITQLNSVNSIAVKAVLARIIVFLILGFWALRINWVGRWTGVYTTAFWPLLALGLWCAGTLFFSPFDSVGWETIFADLYLPLWYLLLTQTCFEIWRAENLIITFLAAALGSALWALAQACGLDSGPWGSIVRSDFQGRVTAGLGNPDFFAGYLLTAWPLALALWIRASSTMAKTWWAFTFAALWAAIFLTESRAGWLGGIVGLAVFALFFFWKNPEAKKTRLGLAGAVLVLILATCILPLGSRLSGLAHPQNASIQFRQEVWKGVWNLITAHPIAGTGFGTFEAAYPPYRPEALMLHQAQRSYEVSHPHNWILEWTADEGGMGLVLLFLFAFAILSQWWKLYAARAIPRALGAGAFAVFAGAAVDNLFDVNASLPSTLIPLLFVAALPVALSNRFSHFPGFPIRSRTWDLKNYKLYLAPVTLLAVLLMLAQVQSAMRHQLTDGMLKKAESFSQQRKWDEAIGMYGRILKLDGSNVEALYFRGASYLDRKSEGDAALALADFQALQTRNPDYVLVHFKKAEALKRLNRLPEAQSEMDQAVRLDPVLIFQDSTFVRAQNWTGKKRYREALALYQKLLFDYPACVPLLLNTANTLVERGKGQSALELYRRVLVYDPGNSDALSNAAAVRTSMGRNGKD